MDIEARLRIICNQPGERWLRPFRPNPRWKTAEVFVIGSNPATPLDSQFPSFDAYWDALTRDPGAFDRAYRAAHKGGASVTGARLGMLLRHLRGINVLVTNAAAWPVGHNGRVPSEQWKTGEEIFRLLFSQARPRVVLTHGKHARTMIQRVLDVSLDPTVDPRMQNTRAQDCLLLCAPHFSGAGLPRGTRYSVVEAVPVFAERIRSALG